MYTCMGCTYQGGGYSVHMSWGRVSMYTCTGCTCQEGGYHVHMSWGRVSVCTCMWCTCWVQDICVHMRGVAHVKGEGICVCMSGGKYLHAHVWGCTCRARVSMCICVRVHMCMHASEGQKANIRFLSIIIYIFKDRISHRA